MEDCYELIIAEIASLYERYNFLEDEQYLSVEEIVTFKQIKSGTAKKVHYQRSLKQISEYLYRYYKQKVVILIDEYDTPIHAGYGKFYDDVVSFMGNLMSGAYKDNDYLYKGVITGILRVSKESIFSGLNNIAVYSILDHPFSQQFGFTETETKQILQDFAVDTDYEQVKKWYDGYTFGKSTDIYNPWSVLNYVCNVDAGFKTYWVNTSSDELLRISLQQRDAEQIREKLLKLINNETIEQDINENFVFPDLDADSDLVWSLLAFSGYLTTVSKRGVNTYQLKIPNYELKFVFKNIILNWLKLDVKIKKSLLEETANHLTNNRIPAFEKGFKQIMGDTFSYFDLRGEPENVYQAYVLGLLAIVGDDYIIRSNRESGDGRYDIMLIPYDKTQNGVVIEIKQIKREANEADDDFMLRINGKIKEAASQIDQNEYYKELVDHQVVNIIKLPIVFAGKVPYVIPK